MPPKTKKRVAKKSLVCWNKEGKTICAGKSTFSNYKPRPKKKKAEKPVVKKTVAKKPVVKKPVVKKATKTGFTKAKQKMIDNIPISIYGTGMITMSGDEAVKAIKKVKKDDDWENEFKKIRAKINESVKYYS